MILGILSDTHGTLHPRLLSLFREVRVERILHAGDVGNAEVMSALEEVAPVLAVRGNIDTGATAYLPEEVQLLLEGVTIYMTHIGGKPDEWLHRLPTPHPAVAICGHSHIPVMQSSGGTLFLNPGAGGARPRFGRPLTAGLLRVENGRAEAEIINL